MMDHLYFILVAAFFPVSETVRTHWITIEGEAFVVQCSCALDSSVTWHLADMEIPTDKGAQVHSSGNQLWFLPASPKDSGIYTCVETMNASSKCETVNVTIHPHKDGICYYKDALYVDITGSRKSGNIYCPTVEDYENASDFKWYKDCKELHGSRYNINDRTLSIADANESDTGNYTCQFTYRHGGRNFTVSATRGFRIAEKYPRKSAEILYPKPDEVINVEIGCPLNLSCKAFLGYGDQTEHGNHWEYNGEKNPQNFVTNKHLYMENDKKQFIVLNISTEKVTKAHLGLNFTCVVSNDMGYKTVNVTLSEGKRKGHNNIYLIVAFIILLVVITLLGVLYHFFRIDIVLLYRRIFNCSERKEDGKIYDAYVIYPTSSINGIYENNFMGSFVHQILLEVLENKCGYKLCVYGRDVFPGEDAIHAIEQRIQKSRRVIILLTQCLATGGCSVMEHQIALYSALIQNNVKVILLEMEKIGEYSQLQDSLRHLIHQQGTIKWKAKYMAHPSSTDSAFWKHVKYQMPASHNHVTVGPI